MVENNEDIRLGQLRSRNKSKQRVAFDAIYADYADKLLIYCLRLIHNKEVAEDVVQETFNKFYLWVTERKEIKSVSGLLYTIAKSNCIRYFRDNKHKSTANFDDVKEFYEDESAVTGHTKDNDDAINIALNQLADIDRDVIILAYYCDYSHKEIADMLEMKVNNVNVQAYRAKQRLGKILKTIMSEEKK